MSANLYLGCPIWAHKGWVGEFFPPGTKEGEYLRQYARRLTAVEGNTTFYAVPAASTLQEWAAQTPESFRFCPKLPRFISHSGKLAERTGQAQQFIETLSVLGARLGPMFLQLPPRYPPGLLPDLQTFLRAWPSQVRLAVEVRHAGWFEPPHQAALHALLGERNMANVVIDTRPIRSLQGDLLLAGSVYERMLAARQRKPDLPIHPVRTASFTFLRYIGHPQLQVNQPYLMEWSERLAEWLRAGADAYVFCHCPLEDMDPLLCRQLHRLVAQKVSLEALPWDDADAHAARQERLF